MSFLKQYGGWILCGVFAAVILYLIFRPVYSPDNSALQHKVDSLSTDNVAIRKAYNELQARIKPTLDSLGKITDSAVDESVILNLKLSASEAAKLSLAKQVQYYKSHADTASYDSACDLLATKVISDSSIIDSYQQNESLLISDFGRMINGRDSIITSQVHVIVSDSAVMAAQKELNQTQTAELKKATKRNKLITWIARVLAVVVVSETISLATK